MATVLEGIRTGQTATPYVAAADGALRSAGMWDVEIWMLLGLSGLGFHIVVDPGTCPSSPTAYDWTHVHSAAMRRIGVSARCVECIGDADGFEAARAEAVAMARASLDRGVPAVFRTFDYAEFAILTGYDDSDGVFFVSDITGSADPVLYSNLGRPHGFASLFVQVFEERGTFDLERASADSLRYAVDCWRGKGWPTPAGYGYKVGAEGYQALIGAVERADTDPLGLRYILRILADARAGVATYVRHLDDSGVLPGLGPLADRYSSLAGILARASALLPAEPPYERPLDEAVLPEASKLLREAAGLEAQAIDHLDRLLAG